MFWINIIASELLFVMSNVAKFHMNFNFSIIMLCVFLSSTLTMANPKISSINGASTFINLCSFDFNTICPYWKFGMDLFKKLKQQSQELMTPSNSNIFLIPKTKSTFSCISDTKVYTLNLCPCMSTAVYPCSDIGNVSSTLILLALVLSTLPKYVVLKSEFY